MFDRCSDYLQFFLCAIFTPICTPDIDEAVPPCRNVCEKARNDCLPIIQSKYNQTWPIDCNEFPDYDSDVCISPQAFLPTHESATNDSAGMYRRHTGEALFCIVVTIWSIEL